MNTTGDRFLATFGGAAGAIRSAVAMRDAVRGLGIELRIGVHTGEVEVLPERHRRSRRPCGLADHALGRASELIVSSVTRALVEVSDLRFRERGRHMVKGLEQPIEVFALAT